MGSPMNTFRSGSSITRMGRFLVAMGGRGRSAREAIQWHNMTTFSIFRVMVVYPLLNFYAIIIARFPRIQRQFGPVQFYHLN